MEGSCEVGVELSLPGLCLRQAGTDRGAREK